MKELKISRKIAKEYLGEIPYEVKDAAENADLVRKFGIMAAPTLVVVKGDSFKKYVNASNIKRFVDENCAVNA